MLGGSHEDLERVNSALWAWLAFDRVTGEPLCATSRHADTHRRRPLIRHLSGGERRERVLRAVKSNPRT